MELRREKVIPFSRDMLQVKKLYQEAFPGNEQVPFLLLQVNCWRKMVDCFAYFDGDVFVGFAYILSNENVSYIFFLAVPDSLQSQGYGSLILNDLIHELIDHSILITIEVIDESAGNYIQRLKRLDFYERNGFKLSNHFYHEGDQTYQFISSNNEVDLKSFLKMMKNYFFYLYNVSVE